MLPDDSELRRRLKFFKGKKVTSKYERPKPGEGKSTTFRLHDIALLSRIDHSDISNFLVHKEPFGKLRRERIWRIILQIEQGFISKTQYGVYHFHDEPKRKNVTVMQIDLNTGRFVEAKGEKVIQMPSFGKIFGG